MGLCSDSTSYCKVFGPCLDPSFIPCEEKKQFQFCCILTVFPIRIESALPPIRIVVHQGLPPLDHDWRKGPAACHQFEN